MSDVGQSPQTLPFQVWCECGHISGQHAVAFPHKCACDGNRWIDGRGSVCNCQAFTAAVLVFSADRKL
jgi:hypothetical protein